THYPDTNEAFAAYTAGSHRHTPEIEQTLSILAGKPMKVTFVPHLLPVNRGIESSIYVQTKLTKDEVRRLYEDFYANERFVRLMPDGQYANIKNIRVSNYCDISLHMDKHTSTLIISSVIDNMVKGAAGQAIQNMNIRFGFEEAAGLLSAPPVF
nr:N-acetyl-gamma-glutamyl-phosphate reductase [Clostridia bacterium]